MDLMVANPAGFWMLLGVPAVLAIHFLQNRSPRVSVSTLFLLDRLAEEEHRGSAFDRLRQSAALWLQLLAVLLLTLLLVRPMPLRGDSVQSVVIVLDNSHSMRAFERAVRRELDAETQRIGKRAATTEWLLQTTDPSRSTLYAGVSREAFMDALDDWHPNSSEHDHKLALRRATELAGAGGLTVYVSDQIVDSLPPGVALLAVGEPLANVGFASLAVDREPDGNASWRAVLINHGDSLQKRELTLEHDGVRAAPEPLELMPGQVRILRGEIPEGIERIRLVLTPSDAFPIDDQLCVLPTHRRVLPASVGLADETLADWANRIMAATPDVMAVSDPSQSRLLWTQSDSFSQPTNETSGSGNKGIHRITLGHNLPTNSLASGPVVAETHPLTRDLSWHGLLCRVQAGLPLGAGDQPLLWMGNNPLIVLRHGPDSLSELQLRFDIRGSNADRHPAIILLINRFLERVRRQLPGEEAGIVELNQRLDLPPTARGAALTLLSEGSGMTTNATLILAGAPVHAPAEPGFFTVRQGDKTVFTGTAVFTETREADFRPCASRNDLDKQSPEQIRVFRRDDRFAPLWLALLGLVVLASWTATMKSSPVLS
jgi:hypothetical protein